jgi:hypothetical protein
MPAVAAQPESLCPAIFGSRAVLLGLRARARNLPISSPEGYRRELREPSVGHTQSRGFFPVHGCSPGATRASITPNDTLAQGTSAARLAGHPADACFAMAKQRVAPAQAPAR